MIGLRPKGWLAHKRLFKMSAAWISLFALAVIILVSRHERINVGVLAMGSAWAIGTYGVGMTTSEIVHLFPWPLFIVLFGITRLMIHSARGNTLILPVNVFMLAVVLSMIGPGNIGAVALLAPFVMPLAGRVGIKALFMTIILVTGANAGTFSPFAPTGIIANVLTSRFGLEMDHWTQIFLPAFLVQTFVAFICYLILVSKMWKNSTHLKFDVDNIVGAPQPLTGRQITTLAAIGLLMIGVVFFRLDIGFWAISLAAVLMLTGVSDGEEAVKKVPWNVIILVCGVSTLVGLMEKAGGLNLFTEALAKVSSPTSVTGMIALLTGIISTYSSSSGVVMPAFIPIVPDLVEKTGGNPTAIVASINVGSHLVDVSPLSTLGAICIANAAQGEDRRRLFHHLLSFGLSMAVVGGGLCHLFFGLLPWFL
jgi:Na+/H+ antiporter NhaD/arsenite permease-like protein